MAALLEVARARLCAHTEQMWRTFREYHHQQQDHTVNDEEAFAIIKKAKEEAAADRPYTNNLFGGRWRSSSNVKIHNEHGLVCKTHSEVDLESGVCGECGWHYSALDKTGQCQHFVAELNGGVQRPKTTHLNEFAEDQTGGETFLHVHPEAEWDLIDPEEVCLNLGSMNSTPSLCFEDDDMQKLPCREEVEVNNDALSDVCNFEERENSWYTALSHFCSDREIECHSASIAASDLDDESHETVNQKDDCHPIRAPFGTPILDFVNGGFAAPGFNQLLEEVRLDHSRILKRASSLPELRSLEEIKYAGIRSLRRCEADETRMFKSPLKNNVSNQRQEAEMVAEPQSTTAKDSRNATSESDWPENRCSVPNPPAVCSLVTGANGKASVNKKRGPSFDSLYDVSDDEKDPILSFRQPSINVYYPVASNEGHWPSQRPAIQPFVRACEEVRITSLMEPKPSQKSPLRSEANSARPGGNTHRTHLLPVISREAQPLLETRRKLLLDVDCFNAIHGTRY